MSRTPKARLVEILLKEDLDHFVMSARAEGHGWRRIAAELTTRTKVATSHENLRTWFAELDRTRQG